MEFPNAADWLVYAKDIAIMRLRLALRRSPVGQDFLFSREFQQA
jgi:hypothetical protein